MSETKREGGHKKKNDEKWWLSVSVWLLWCDNHCKSHTMYIFVILFSMFSILLSIAMVVMWWKVIERA